MGRRGTWMDAQVERERQRAKTMNPVWRGVGCILILVMAGVGWVLSGIFLEANAVNRWIPIPRQLYNPAQLPFLADGLLIKIVVAFFSLLFAYAILNFIYAIFFPIQPGEYDLPTPRRRRRRRP